MATLETRLEDVRKGIASAASRSGRDPNSIRLVASSRTLMVDPVVAAAEAGLTHFCEDFLPEGVTKRPPVDRRVKGLEWHFTGDIPAPKVHLALEFFDWIHTVDRLTLLRPLKETVDKSVKGDRVVKVLIELNPMGHQKRTGISMEEAPALAQGLGNIPKLKLAGISLTREPFMAAIDLRSTYRNLRFQMQQWREEGIFPLHATELAFGSSRDFEIAVEEGATLLRLGSALFGPRPGF